MPRQIDERLKQQELPIFCPAGPANEVGVFGDWTQDRGHACFQVRDVSLNYLELHKPALRGAVYIGENLPKDVGCRRGKVNFPAFGRCAPDAVI